MNDDTEHGASRGSGAPDPDLPTVDEVEARQAEEFPDQARTATHHPPPTAAELAALDAGGEVVDDPDELLIEGPNPA